MTGDELFEILKNAPPIAHAQTVEIYHFFQIIEQEKYYERLVEDGMIHKDFYFITFPEPYLGMMDIFARPVMKAPTSYSMSAHVKEV